MNIKKIAIEVISCILISLFIYAAVNKLIDFKYFNHQMNQQPFDDSYTPFLVIALPTTELIICLLFLFNKTRLLGHYLYLFIMSVFTAYIILIKLKAFEHVPCACGGVISGFTWGQHLVLNFIFLLLTIVNIYLIKNELNSSEGSVELKHGYV